MSFAEFSPRVDIASSPETSKKPEIVFGSYLPKTVLTNQEIESWRVLTPNGHPLTAESIRKRTGVIKRYVADKNETPFSMALHASQEALAKTGKNIDAVIVSTSFPTGENLSSKLQNEFGVSGFHLDVHAACSGFTLSLAYLKEREKEFLGKKILFVATEKYSPHLYDLRSDDAHNDASLAQTIFSDGAVAMIFEYGKDLEVISTMNKNFPKEVNDYIKMPIDRSLLTSPFFEIPMPPSASGKLEQDGKKVYEVLCENVPPLIKDTVSSSNLNPLDIQTVFPHQGSFHIVKGLYLRLNEYSVYRDFEEGNFSSASIPKALSKAFEKGEIKKGDTVVLAGFGAGLFASVAVVKFG